MNSTFLSYYFKFLILNKIINLIELENFIINFQKRFLDDDMLIRS